MISEDDAHELQFALLPPPLRLQRLLGFGDLSEERRVLSARRHLHHGHVRELGLGQDLLG